MKKLHLSIVALSIALSFVVIPQQAQAFEFALGPKVDLGVGFFSVMTVGTELTPGTI